LLESENDLLKVKRHFGLTISDFGLMMRGDYT
jgi:hypothetical protein